jgi:CRISPR-associated protein Cmr5
VERVLEEEKKSYGSMAHTLPVLIRTAGLAQALVFVSARGSSAQKRLLTDVTSTVRTLVPTASADGLVTECQDADLVVYMQLTQQVLDALLWYKRFAQTVLGVDGTEENGGGI